MDKTTKIKLAKSATSLGAALNALTGCRLEEKDAESLKSDILHAELKLLDILSDICEAIQFEELLKVVIRRNIEIETEHLGD